MNITRSDNPQVALSAEADTWIQAIQLMASAAKIVSNNIPEGPFKISATIEVRPEEQSE